MLVPLHYDPREYQAEALRALDMGCILNIWCWARRGGKDLTAFAYAARKMVEGPINIVLVFPTKEQGKNAFWENLENDGFKTLEHIPAELVERCDNSNMRLILKNGSTFQILGATDPNALRGANARLYIFSEFVDIPSEALQVIRPIVANNGGQIIIQSTPKIDGISGGTFKILFDRADKIWKSDKKTQFASLVTAHTFLKKDALEELRQEAIAQYGNDFFYRQEYECDWGQASSTSFYSAVLQEIRKREQIGKYPYDPTHPVYRVWDLGTADSTAIVFFQYINKKVIVIDYFETHDIGYAPIVAAIKMKPYNVVWDFFPHDANTRDQSDAIERIEKLRDLGLVNSSVLKRERKDDGINRAVSGMIDTYFNQATTKDLRRKLGLYKRKFNKYTGDYEGPEHKTESHGADATQYMYQAIKLDFDEKTGAFMYAPDQIQDGYEMDEISTPDQYSPF